MLERAPTAFRLRIRTAFGGAALLVTIGMLSVSPLSHAAQPSNMGMSHRVANTTRLAFTVEVFNPQSFTELLTQILPYLTPGDTIDLGNSTPANTPNITRLNEWANELAPLLPPGINLTARVETLPNVRLAAQGLSSLFDGISADWEPSKVFFPNNWTWNFTAALDYYQNVTVICHEYGLLAIAYPSGAPLLDRNLTKYNWDYAEIAQTVDLEKVETQSYGLPNEWSTAIAKLEGQFSNRSVPLDRLSTQITVGSTLNDVNAVSAVDAVSDVDFALNESISSIYLWWELDSEPAFFQVLGAHRIPHWPITIAESGLPPRIEWWVNLTDGESFNSTATTLTFKEPNGTFSYSASASGFSKIDGNFIVGGESPASVLIDFSAAPLSSTGPPILEFAAFGVVTLALIVTLIVVLARGRRKSPPRPRAIPTDPGLDDPWNSP
jgi:hypothetical protein